MSETPERLRITFQNERPIELLEFTAALAAVGDEYRRFRGDKDGVLRIERITEGSIDAVLTDIGGTLAPLVPIGHSIVTEFTGHWIGALKMLANYGRDALADAKAKKANKSTIRNAMTFAGPAANGNATFVCGDNNLVVTNPTFNLDQATGTAIIRNGAHLLAPAFPDERRFESEPLRLYQVRDAKAGDLGFIDIFSLKPKRLIFANEAVKAEMLHGEINPFDVFFYVSGLVKTAGGEVAGYHIDKIDGVTPRDAA